MAGSFEIHACLKSLGYHTGQPSYSKNYVYSQKNRFLEIDHKYACSSDVLYIRSYGRYTIPHVNMHALCTLLG